MLGDKKKGEKEIAFGEELPSGNNRVRSEQVQGPSVVGFYESPSRIRVEVIENRTPSALSFMPKQ